MNQQTLFITAIILGGSYMIGQYIVSDPVRNADRVITVSAVGTAVQKPNIAHVALGVSVAGQVSSAQATDMMAKKINAVLSAVRALGIEDKDIATQAISVNPAYDYNNGTQVPKGFDASQQLTIKIRKVDGAGDVVAKAVQAGANQIGGISFTSDDQQGADLSAEQDGITKAEKKAQALASALHVRLGKVKTYSVDSNSPRPVPYAMEAKASSGDTVTAPEVPAGEQEVRATVTITYEVR